jgi:isoleucyl-tRNA synthetase
VLTHGFVLDGEGRKMSKSLGNTVAPQQICDKYGADILRLWTVTSDYTEDLRISMPIVEAQAETYRRLRNTLRYVLGNLADFDERERLPLDQMPEIDRWVLHRLYELDVLLRKTVEDFDFQKFYTELHTFCVNDLSAFYFDIQKDTLYCDRLDSITRRATRTVLDHLFHCLTTWLAPALVFTAEEAWLARFPGEAESVHLQTFPEIPLAWRSDDLGVRVSEIRRQRRVVTGALEVQRAKKEIGSSLEAKPRIVVPETLREKFVTLWGGVSMSSVMATSSSSTAFVSTPIFAQKMVLESFSLPDVPEIVVDFEHADGKKCARCWKVLPEVGKGRKPDLCLRCDDAVAKA